MDNLVNQWIFYAHKDSVPADGANLRFFHRSSEEVVVESVSASPGNCLLMYTKKILFWYLPKDAYLIKTFRNLLVTSMMSSLQMAHSRE